ncbi:hypothetical protein VR610_10050 [Aquirufa regiilacus]
MFNLHQLHTASGMIVLLAFILKVGIQIYLDNSLGKAKTWQSILFFPLPFMTPYRGKVSAENHEMKNLCNLMFYTCVVALSINLVVGILEYQTK